MVEETRDEQGRLASFEQLGWQVSYGQYRTVGERELPRRVTVERPGYRVRLVISEWQLPEI